MKLESLLNQLDNVRKQAESDEFSEFHDGYIEKIILQLLIDYIGNPKIEEAVNEIPF